MVAQKGSITLLRYITLRYTKGGKRVDVGLFIFLATKPVTISVIAYLACCKMPLGMEVGLSPGDFGLDGDQALPLPKGRRRPGAEPEFSAHGYCGRTAGWIKMALGMEVGLGPVHIVLDGDTALLPKQGQSPPPKFLAHLVAKRLDASKCHLVRR